MQQFNVEPSGYDLYKKSHVLWTCRNFRGNHPIVTDDLLYFSNRLDTRTSYYRDRIILRFYPNLMSVDYNIAHFQVS